MFFQSNHKKDVKKVDDSKKFKAAIVPAALSPPSCDASPSPKWTGVLVSTALPMPSDIAAIEGKSLNDCTCLSPLERHIQYTKKAIVINRSTISTSFPGLKIVKSANL